MIRASRITKIAIFAVACTGLAAGSFAARMTVDTPQNSLAALKQALEQEVAPDMVAAVFDDLRAIAQDGDREGKLAMILNTYGLSPSVEQLTNNLIMEAPAQMVATSDREMLKQALVQQLPADQAASLFEQLSLTLQDGGSVEAVLSAAGLSRTQLDTLTPVVNDWMASVGTR